MQTSKIKISDILEEKENFLLNRREVKVIVEADKNPSFQDAENLILEKYKADKELVVVKGIKGKFGRNTFLISAFIYKNKEDKERFEPKKKGKKTEKQAQTAQEQPASIPQEKQAKP